MNSAAFVTVRNVMTAHPICVDGMATVDEAIELMRRHNISSLVVERRDETDEYGLVLVSDLAREIVGQGRPGSRVSVYEVMTKPTITVDAEMNIKYAVRLMTRHEQSHCIVVAGRQLVGVMTLRDALLGHSDGAQDATIPQLKQT